MSNIVYHFDMDGVLCDWVDMYGQRSDIPLEVFNAMSREERDVIKQDLFDYDFFRNMRPIQEGLNLLIDAMNSGNEVRILSASGRANRDEVIRAKRDWIAANIGGDIVAEFVDKVEMKPIHMVDGAVNILIDDRDQALDAWREAGGVAIKFDASCEMSV